MSVKSTNTGIHIGVDAGTDTWEELCTTDHSLDRTVETDDITDMCSEGWRETSSQLRQVSVPINGIYKSSQAAYDELLARYVAVSSKTYTIDATDYVCDWGQVPLKYTAPDGTVYTGVAQINSLGESSNYNQDVRFSLDMQFSGSVASA